MSKSEQWWDKAACRNPHTIEWFDEVMTLPPSWSSTRRTRGPQGDEAELVDACKHVCATCPVRDQCRADALAGIHAGDVIPAGVWGGLDWIEQYDAAGELSSLCISCRKAEPFMPGYGYCEKCHDSRVQAVINAVSAA